MEIRCAFTELVPIARLKGKFHPKNPNVHTPEQIERLAKVLGYQGARTAARVSKRSNLLTAGHGRIMAAEKAGATHYPVDYQDYENEEQEYADLVADNALSDWAALDLSGINAHVPELGPDFDLDMLGIKDFELVIGDTLEPGCDEDEVPTNADTRVKLGDVWTLGRHRLMCGDSTAITDVEKLMAGRADITFTSPPYNAAKNGHLTGQVAGFDNKYQAHNDAMSDDDYLELLTGFTDVAFAKSDYVFVNIQLLTHNRVPLFKYQAHYQSLIKDILIWNKTQCPPNIVKGAFNTKWEYVFCLSNDTKTRGFPCDWRGQYPNVVDTESNAANEHAESHKAGFPVSFPCWFLEKFDFAKTVFDPFGGTGTTMIACEKLGRQCFMLELSPAYCDVILARWEKYSGQKAERLAGAE